MKTGLNPAETILEKLITFRNEIFKNFRLKSGSFFIKVCQQNLTSWLDFLYIGSKAINALNFILSYRNEANTG